MGMGMLGQQVRTSVENGVIALLREVGDGSLTGMEELRLTVEQPGQLRHGDYATNAPLQLTKRLRLPPMKLAEQLARILQRDPWLGAIMARIETAPPGFVNFYIDWREWACCSFTLPPAPSGKVIIEHTSINPNKSSHVGHLRNSCIGDTLGRLLKRLGYKVEIHNYIDDLGNQLADTVVGLLNLPVKGKHQRFGDYCWDLYAAVNRRYEEEPELAGERSRVLHALEEGGSNLAWLGTLTAERIVREHLEEMAGFQIGYDLLVWESNIVREGFWDAAAQLLATTGLFVQVEEGKLAGCRILKQNEEETPADSEYVADKVLVRSNGILTYTAKDIAYHLWKFGLLGRDFRYKPWGGGLWTTAEEGEAALPFGSGDMVINVIDQRQEYPQAVVKQALAALGFRQQADRLRHVAYGVVSLSPASAAELGVDTSAGKASYAMSGRQGIGIRSLTLLSRMEEIICSKSANKEGISSQALAAAAIRYYLLRYNLQTEVVFDLEQATEVTGNTGIYLMYAYARSCNVLGKAKEASGPVAATVPESFPLLAEEEHALLRHLSGWQETLAAAGAELAPHLIANYAYELAALFNQFYAHCPILKAGEETLLRFRLWLTDRFRETLGDALQVLGLPAPESM
ncbi:arginine--tRNA ligase [Paenibacillus sp. YN15]|uniref:arginine--tRNA ligase n=1 Tax=Paenibacillus sp. YN15 TaxID=1742774 RepID=UPI000DCD4196|nr:arginine--tRNA ligase [Paenibacillus sp. YN15]RAV05445.1 arginine--tRNA ligase [Paenibacillus sp. YN15]